QLHAIAVVLVGDGVDDRHRAGQRELELALCVRADVARLGLVYPAAGVQRAGDDRDHRLVAVGADADLDLVLEVDAGELLEEAVHEVLARLLAVAHHVDAGVLLELDREQRRVELGGGELGAGQSPRRPQAIGFGEPGRFRQAAGDGGGEHAGRNILRTGPRTSGALGRAMVARGARWT